MRGIEKVRLLVYASQRNEVYFKCLPNVKINDLMLSVIRLLNVLLFFSEHHGCELCGLNWGVSI